MRIIIIISNELTEMSNDVIVCHENEIELNIRISACMQNCNEL